MRKLGERNAAASGFWLQKNHNCTEFFGEGDILRQPARRILHPNMAAAGRIVGCCAIQATLQNRDGWPPTTAAALPDLPAHSTFFIL